MSLFKKEGANINGNNLQNNQGATFFSGYSIDRHGNIRLPYLGEINVLGYTTREVRTKVEEKVKAYIEDDTEIFVTVRLNGIKYTVMGEVGSPGPKVIFQNQVSILDAITNSGDITCASIGNRVSGCLVFLFEVCNFPSAQQWHQYPLQERIRHPARTVDLASPVTQDLPETELR